jgi:NADH:ubiquinone oxidoreductase subunit B-like Fe-S oxidoreductase
MGACATTGGVFDTYATVQGIEQFMPMDMYVPACPPTAEMFIEGVMAIQRLIDQGDAVSNLRKRTVKKVWLNCQVVAATALGARAATRADSQLRPTD